MTYKDNQTKECLKRKPFRDAVKVFMKCNCITQNEISDRLGVTKQEFSNLMTGYQNSVPSKGIDCYSDFEYKVMKLLGRDFTEGHIQY